MGVRVVEAATGELRARAFALRRAVFVDEQRVPLALERDGDDDAAFHAAALLGDRLVGTGRLAVQPGGVGRVGRMAVDGARRGRGVGAALLDALEERARAIGLGEIVLHAQCHAEGFYARHGYLREGAVFEEAGIPHVQMRKRLRGG